MDVIQLYLARRDEILHETVQCYEEKIHDVVNKQKKEVMRTTEKERDVTKLNYEELIARLYQTELSIRSETEETTKDILTQVEQGRQEIKDKINNILFIYIFFFTFCFCYCFLFIY